MARIRTILRALAALTAWSAYVWYRAVLSVPAVRRRKAARRAAARAAGGPH